MFFFVLFPWFLYPYVEIFMLFNNEDNRNNFVKLFGIFGLDLQLRTKDHQRAGEQN